MVRQGDENPQLRLSLRGLVAHLPHDRVFIAGHRPAWVTGVEHVPTRQPKDRWQASLGNLLEACRSSDLSERFVLFHDDFFILRAIDAVPLMHRGALALHVRRSAGEHRRHLVKALELCRSWGVEEPISYDVHVPMPMDRTGVLEVAERANGQAAGAIRSLYGNAAGLIGQQITDVKTRTRFETPPEDATFVSTGNPFGTSRAAHLIRARLPEPCRYEAVGGRR